MKISKEARLGLIVISGIAVLLWGLNYLKGRDFFKKETLVFAKYSSVEGLANSNPVVVNGLKIGMVNTLSLLDGDGGKILVRMHITDKVHIPKDSRAEIFNMDILGSKGIRFILGTSKVFLQDGDTVGSMIQNSLQSEVSAQVAPIKAKAESILSSMDSVLSVIREVFNAQTKDNLRKSFESISNSLTSIQHITGNLDTVLGGEGRLRNIFENIESITTNFKSGNEKLTRLIDNFSSISDTIARANISETIGNLKKTMEQTNTLMSGINNGDGTLGQLATNDSLYTNLNNSSIQLDSLLKDFRQNPGRYVKVSFLTIGGGKKR